MISEERKFCTYCKRESFKSPCEECTKIFEEFHLENKWDTENLQRYTEILFNREFFEISSILMKHNITNGLTFDEIHNRCITTYSSFELSQILTSLMILGFCYQVYPEKYKFRFN